MGESYSATPTVTPTMGLVQFDHGGETVRYYNNSASELPAGTPIIQGDLFGVPVRPIPAYSVGALMIEGAMLFPKSATDAGLTAGAKGYWDATNSIATSIAAGNRYLGKVECGLGADGTPLSIATADTIVYIQVEAVADASATTPLNFTASGTIPAHSDVLVTTSRAATLTLAAPTSGADDGKSVTFINNSTHASVLSAAGLILNGSNGTAVGTATAAAAVAGPLLKLVALSGKWVLAANQGFTLS